MQRFHADTASRLAGQTPVPMPIVRLSEARTQAKDEEEAGAMTSIPFGKHAGTPIEELPLDYIAWCLKNLTSMRPGLKRAMERVLEQDPTSNSVAYAAPVVDEIERRPQDLVPARKPQVPP